MSINPGCRFWNMTKSRQRVFIEMNILKKKIPKFISPFHHQPKFGKFVTIAFTVQQNYSSFRQQLKFSTFVTALRFWLPTGR